MDNLAHVLTMDWLQWLLTIELLGAAALPLASFLFRSFPDRGYGLAKPLALLLVFFLNFWLGSVASLANYPVILWLLTVLLAAGGVALYARGLAILPDDRHSLGRTIAVEEGLFLVAFAAWSLVRGLRPDIFATEKPMDYMLLQVSGATHGFPPPDAWLSGHTVNYYYLGYAMFGMLGRMAGVDPRVCFNLCNVVIFALGCSSAFSLGLALTKSRLWALAGAFALMLAGNLDTIPQVVAQLFSGGLNGEGLNLWCSTRILDGGCSAYHTIIEFPIFSLLWNDLHPHVMAIPFVLLALALGVQALQDPPLAWASLEARYVWIGCAAVLLGALFGINSWDFPTYTAFVVLCLVLAASRHGEPRLRALVEAISIVPLSLLLYVPYLLTVHNSESIGLHVNPTQLGDTLTVIGGSLMPVAIFAAWRGAVALAEQATQQEEPVPLVVQALRELPPGGGWWILFVLVLLAIVWPARIDMIYVCLIIAIAYALITRRERETPEIQAVLLLALIAGGVLLISDLAYLKDNFDGTPSYRMNTVFKLYCQAWILLAVAIPVCIQSIGSALGRISAQATRTTWYVLAGILALGTALYPIEGIGSQGPSLATGTPGLDGLAYVKDLAPGEYAAVEWILRNTSQFAVVAEGYGSDYWLDESDLGNDANLFSALTGRPTLIGWPGSHEALWRGDFGGGSSQASADAMISKAKEDDHMLFTAPSKQVALQILREYKVQYVVVGPFERSTTFTAGGKLTDFSAFLTPVLRNSAVTIYRVP